MRAQCQLEIEPSSLYEAIHILTSAYSEIGTVIPSTVFLRPRCNGVLVATDYGEVGLEGTGHWLQSIGVNGYPLAVLAYKLADAECLRLLFTGSKLIVNVTAIDAWHEPMPIRLEHVAQGWQQLLPGFEPVSETDRLQHRVNQPLRPRVGQYSLVGTALFGK